MEHFYVISRFRPLHAGDHRIGIGQLPKLHALLAGNSGADHDYGTNALCQCPCLLFGDKPGEKAGTHGAEDGRGQAPALRMSQRSK